MVIRILQDPLTNINKYYMPLVETKDFNVLIDNKPFWSVCKQQTRRVWKAHWNVKKWSVSNRKLIRLFVSSEIL